MCKKGSATMCATVSIFVISSEIDTNSWNFTRLGRITNTTQSELRSLLSGGNVTITISLASTTGTSEIKTEDKNAQGKKGIISLDEKRLEKTPAKGGYIENRVKKVKMQ